MAGIKLMVQRTEEEGMWQVKIGYTPWRHFQSQRAAIGAALERAKTMSLDGIECEVVMKIMTCRFAPGGFSKTVPTSREIDWESIEAPRETEDSPTV